MENNKYKNNIWKIYVFQFFRQMMFISGVLIPFFTEWGNLDFSQIMILQSLYLIGVFVLEIPTGVVADYISRKFSISLGIIFNILGILLYAVTQEFYLFIIAELLWAVSTALTSGANEAFIYDSLKKIGKTKKSKEIFSRFKTIGLIGMMIAGPIGSLLGAEYGIRTPLIAMVIPFGIAFLISLTLKEPISEVKQESKRYLNILKTGFNYFIKHDALKKLAIDFIVIDSIAYFIIWLYQPMLLRSGFGIAFLGIMSAALLLSEIIVINSFKFAEKLIKSKRKVIFITSLVTGLAFIVGGLTEYLPVVIVAILLVGGFGLSRRALFVSYFNKHIESEQRATVNSSIMMFKMFVLAVINPFVGYLTDWSLSYVLIILGVFAVTYSFISRVEEKHLID